jgi:hypothetical protein
MNHSGMLKTPSHLKMKEGTRGNGFSKRTTPKKINGSEVKGKSRTFRTTEVKANPKTVKIR